MNNARSCSLALALVAVHFSAAGLFAAERPNLIVIFTDDHGYSDLSAQGVHKDVRTPNVDALAAEGVRMTSGYVSAPQCVPSRAGLLTGCYQNRFGVESNKQPLDGFNARATIAERLKRAGYATGMAGKWHLGPAPEIVRHGFEQVYNKNANRPGWANFNLDGSDRQGGAEDSKLYHLDVNTEAACAFIRRHRAKPFFFYCAYRAPHVPLDAPPKYLDRFPGEMPERRRQALAMLAAVDDGVGKIVRTLREHQLAEKTLIFFIGDNGAPLKIHKIDAPGGGPGWDGSLNDPLNGEKGMLAEGGIRVPFVVRWKGRIPAGQVCHHPVISLDVAATALAAAGLPADPALDGADLLPSLRGEADQPPHERLYWRWIAQSAVREGKWKYLRGGPREYLFDLDADPEETRNLIQRHPETAKRLSAGLEKWAAELQPPGIESKSLGGAWESYFDHYLDGKPQARPAAPGLPEAPQPLGWVARGSTARIKDGLLQVVPSANSRRVFLARDKLKFNGPLTAGVRLRASQDGRVGFSWREQGQQDFPAGQSVTTPVKAAEQIQDVQLKIPARGKTIHLRLLLPSGETHVRDIDVQDDDGKTARWRFQTD